MTLSALAAMLLAGSRAAMLGFVCGSMVLAVKAKTSRRVVLVAGGALILVTLIVVTGASESAQIVLRERRPRPPVRPCSGGWTSGEMPYTRSSGAHSSG